MHSKLLTTFGVGLILAACTPAPAGPQTYTDADLGISFTYNADQLKLDQREATVSVYPAIQDLRIRGPRLTHTVDKEHCGLSGLPEHCTSKTTDFSLQFGLSQFKFSELRDTLQADWPEADLTPIAGHDAMKIWMGVEGEGVVYTFIDTGRGDTLIAARTFIDQQILIGYQEVPDFIPMNAQEELGNSILASLKFVEPVAVESKPVNIVFPSQGDIDNADITHPIFVTRGIEDTGNEVDAALQGLFNGPLQEEQAQGARMTQDLRSLRDLYQGVSYSGETVTVDFGPQALAILNGAAARQHMAKSPIEQTIKANRNVTDITYSIDGTVFEEWDA